MSNRVSGERWDIAQEHHKGFWDYWKHTESVERKQLYVEYWQYYLDLLNKTMPLNDGIKILEIGCGIDGIISYIKQGDKYAVDPLVDYFLSEFNMPKNIKWIKGIGEDLPFENNYFNIVITTNTIDHTMNPEGVLKEIKRVLKEGGILLVSVDVYTPFVKYYRRFRELIGIGDEAHPYAFSIKDMTKLLEECGFKLLSMHNGIGDFGKYVHKKLSEPKIQNLTSYHMDSLGYYERGLKVLREKGIWKFIYAIFDNIWFLFKNKVKKNCNKLLYIIKKKIDAYSEIDIIFITSK